ncbi:hypothetical protein KKE26_00490, partial [bacterium]|nr:hypothetical protein [bacterium]
LCNVNKIFTTLPLPAGDNLILKYLPIIYYLPISFISLSPFYYLNSYKSRTEGSIKKYNPIFKMEIGVALFDNL